MRNLQIIFILLVLSLNGQITSAQLIITEVGTLPEPVANNAVCEGFIDGVPYLFSFAGIDQTKSAAGTHLRSFRYNIETGVSEQIADLPGDQGLLATGASRIGNIIYIVGGYTVNANGSEVSSRKVRRYDIQNNEYLSDAADLIVPTDDHVQAVWRDSLLYVITGWSNSGNIRFNQVYDPMTDNWTNGSLLPNDNDYTSFGASGTIVNDKIYYFGGARSSGNFPIQNFIRVGIIDPNDPSTVEWSLISLESPLYNGYRTAATSVCDAVHWVGGSNNTYNYDGIAYDGSGGVPTANQEIVFAEDILIDRRVYEMEIPMDLRGIAKISEQIQYIAGGMLADQQVTDKIFKLEFDKTIVPAVKYTAEDLGIVLFPLPATDIISIGYDGPEQLVTYIIVDIDGREVQSGTLKSNSIDVSNLTPANYQLLMDTQSQKTVSASIVIVK